MSLSTSVAVTEGTKLVGPSLVDTFLKPAIQDFARKKKINRQIFQHSIHGKFQKYFERSYLLYAEISALAIPGRVPLKELYLPLTVQSEEGPQKDKTQVLIDGYSLDFLPKYKRILVTDEAGMGKSTLLKFLFLSYIEEIGIDNSVPVFIELRHLRDGKTILDLLHEQLEELNEQLDLDFLKELLIRGDFILFLDGYDEIPLSDREHANKHLKDFLSKCEKDLIILSSRPEDELKSFSTLCHFRIQPLSNEDAFELLTKYDKSGEIAPLLIKEVKKQLDSVEEFLSNPMLVSLLYTAYNHTQTIPLKKSAFYRQVYDALFYRHDTTKPLLIREKKSNLDRDEFEQVLRALGIVTLKKGVGYPKDNLLQGIVNARENCSGINFKESDFLDDLLRAVPLFAADGDYHRWKHKSLQEYFAARFICRDANGHESDLLRAMVTEKKIYLYRNVLDLCYDIDFTLFRNVIIHDLVNSFLDYFDNSFLQVDRKTISEEAITLRKQLCFSRSFTVFPSSMIKYRSDKDNGSALFRKMKEYGMKLGIITEDTNTSGSWIHVHGGILLGNTLPPALYGVLNGRKTGFIGKPPTLQKKTKMYLTAKNGREVRREIGKKSTPDRVCSSEKPVLLDDNASSPWNLESMFLEVNGLLCETLEEDYILLDPDKCRKLQLAIKNENEMSSDFATGLL